MDYHSSFRPYVLEIFSALFVILIHKGGIFFAALLLARKEIDLLAELVHQKAHLCNGISVQFSCPLMAGNLLDIGIDFVQTGVHGTMQFV